MAPKAHIILYKLPDLSDQSFIDGLSRIITGQQDRRGPACPSVAQRSSTRPQTMTASTTPTFFGRERSDGPGERPGHHLYRLLGDSGALAATARRLLRPIPNCGTFLPAPSSPPPAPTSPASVAQTSLPATPESPAILTRVRPGRGLRRSLSERHLLRHLCKRAASSGSGGGDSILFRKPRLSEPRRYRQQQVPHRPRSIPPHAAAALSAPSHPATPTTAATSWQSAKATTESSGPVAPPLTSPDSPLSPSSATAPGWATRITTSTPSPPPVLRLTLQGLQDWHPRQQRPLLHHKKRLQPRPRQRYPERSGVSPRPVRPVAGVPQTPSNP